MSLATICLKALMANRNTPSAKPPLRGWPLAVGGPLISWGGGTDFGNHDPYSVHLRSEDVLAVEEALLSFKGMFWFYLE